MMGQYEGQILEGIENALEEGNRNAKNDRAWQEAFAAVTRALDLLEKLRRGEGGGPGGGDLKRALAKLDNARTDMHRALKARGAGR